MSFISDNSDTVAFLDPSITYSPTTVESGGTQNVDTKKGIDWTWIITLILIGIAIFIIIKYKLWTLFL